jgi:clan AA aspartic protease (TIGR02281 family)
MKYDLLINKRKITVRAQIKCINDSRDVKFILDTGTSKSIIDEDAVRRLGFEIYRLEAGDRLVTAGGGVRSKILKLPKLSLLGKDAVNFEVNVFKLPMQITYFVDGLIGMDFLMTFKNIKFDFDEKTIETEL